MSDRSDYRDAIDSLVQGSVPLSEDADKNTAIALALRHHSKHRPQELATDVDGDGGFDYALSGLTSWVEGFSVIKSVEYPVDDDDQTADVLQDDAWEIYRKPTGRVLRFLSNTPSASESMRICYTAPHACTDTADSSTVEAADEEPVQALCAAFFLEMVATCHAQQGDSAIGADVVDHKSMAAEYAARARALRKMYYDYLGIKEGQTPPASVTMDQDTTPSWQTDHMTHRGRYR